MNCHKCKYNGQKDNHCLNCNGQEQYNYQYQKYIIEGYDAPDNDKAGSDQVTDLDDNLEDKIRKLLYTILDLTPNQILLLKAIHDGKNLTEFGKDMEKQAKSNQKFSRFRAFQTRKSILKSHPELSTALIMLGQRKSLKKD